MVRKFIAWIFRGDVVGWCSGCHKDIRRNDQYEIYEGEQWCSGSESGACYARWQKMTEDM